MADKWFCGLKNQLKSRELSWKSKIVLYKTLIRPVLTYAPESWVSSTCDERVLPISKRKVLRSTYGRIKSNNGWRIRYNYALYKDTDVITFITVSRLKWAGKMERTVMLKL
jgi:hypothetical protein